MDAFSCDGQELCEIQARRLVGRKAIRASEAENRPKDRKADTDAAAVQLGDRATPCRYR